MLDILAAVATQAVRRRAASQDPRTGCRRPSMSPTLRSRSRWPLRTTCGNQREEFETSVGAAARSRPSGEAAR